jgi:4-hydroxy-4-methyl-2-oxoglutarate aldolase
VPVLDLSDVRLYCYTAVVADVCDRLGFRNQTAADGFRPVHRGEEVLVGWARTARSVEVPGFPHRPYGAEIDFIDSLALDEVVVAQSPRTSAFWGELFSAAAVGRGCRGAVIDGLVRDQSRVADLGFPVFARGSRPSDSLGRISIGAADELVLIGGVEVSPGDLVVADVDGVVFVPAAIAADVVRLAVEKARTESSARQLLIDGATLAQAWEKFGVL